MRQEPTQREINIAAAVTRDAFAGKVGHDGKSPSTYRQITRDELQQRIVEALVRARESA